MVDSFHYSYLCNYERLDGAQHGEYDRIEKDENRDKYLETLGFTVIRFENRFALQEPEFLEDEIRKSIKNKYNEPDNTIYHPGRN